MNGKRILLGLVLLAALPGCYKRCFMTEAEFCSSRSLIDLPAVENNPAVGAGPVTSARALPPPSTVEQPAAQDRYICLGEAIAIALESGTVGVNNSQNPGQPLGSLVTFTGQGVSGSDAIRVLALDPARVAADIEAALSRFDARWISTMTWSGTEDPIGTALQEQQAGSQAIDAIQTQSANFSTALLKPLPTGGVAGITFNTGYTLTNLTDTPVNPAYRPQLHFAFEQPLLQGFGVEINQLRTDHPNSILTPFTTSGRGEGILISRVRFDQSRAEFARNVHTLLLNVEAAYWNLYGAYWTLASRDLGLRQAHEVWRRTEGLAQAGRASQADSNQARGQYELFRSDRLAALANVLESERRLRLLMGLPRADGTRLIPADAPTLVPYQPDWHRSLEEALALRPELSLARDQLKVRQFELLREKNGLLPDLRFTSTYDIQGLGNRLDSALSNLLENRYTNWSLGLRLEVPIGYREANARTRAAKVELARSFEVLKDQENKTASLLEFHYRQLFELHAQIRTLRAQREAYGRQLEVRYREFAEGRDVPLPFILEAQRSWSNALSNEYNFIVQYNNALAGFEYAKGTIARANNVVIAEGPLPACAAVRAVVHQRERSKALVLRERESPVVTPPCNLEQGNPGLPAFPTGQAPSLPAVLEGMQTAR